MEKGCGRHDRRVDRLPGRSPSPPAEGFLLPSNRVGVLRDTFARAGSDRPHADDPAVDDLRPLGGPQLLARSPGRSGSGWKGSATPARGSSPYSGRMTTYPFSSVLALGGLAIGGKWRRVTRPRRCPDCGRRAVIPVGRRNLTGVLAGSIEPGWCSRCDARCRRENLGECALADLHSVEGPDYT